MRILATKISFFFFIWFMIVSCQPGNKLEYYYSNDKQKVVTKLSYEGRVYFINGYYDQMIPPLAYITPVSGMDHAYLCYINWKDNQTYLLHHYGKWQTVGKPQNFAHKYVEDNGVYNDITVDKSGEYVRSYGDIYP